MKGENGALVGRYLLGKPEVFGEKPAPVPLRQSLTLHGLTWDRTRASVMIGLISVSFY